MVIIPSIQWPIPKDLLQALPACSAAAASATLRSTAGRRFAATARLAAAPVFSVFVLPGLFPLVLDPLDPWHSNRPGAK